MVGPVTAYIAAELRAQQARHQWTLDDIARRSGIARSTVARALKGESALAVEVYVPICQGMGLDPIALLTEAQRER